MSNFHVKIFSSHVKLGILNHSLITPPPPTTTTDVHQLYFWRTHHTKTLGVTEYTF